jgi:hypothetical protein
MYHRSGGGAAQLDVVLPRCCQSRRFAVVADDTISTTSPSRSMSTTSPASAFAATPPEQRVYPPGADRWTAAGHRGPHRRDRLTGCGDHNSSFEVGRYRVCLADAGQCPVDVPRRLLDRGDLLKAFCAFLLTSVAQRPLRPSPRRVGGKATMAWRCRQERLPVRTRMPGGVGAGSQSLPATRFGIHLIAFTVILAVES